jgi:peptide/nickel transport system permease protein
LRPLASRLVQVLVVVFAVVVVTFMLVHLVPGDPAVTILGTRATPQTIAALRNEMHLNLPLLEQFRLFVTGALRGDLGNSLLPGSPSVTSIVFPALRVTASVIACAVLISVAVGVPLGLISGMTRKAPLDLTIRGLMMVLLAMPPFLVGFLLLIFALNTGAAPAGGWGTNAVNDLQYLWMPGLALAAYLAPLVTRTVRQSASEVLAEDFVEAAIARGLPRWRLVLRHILPNSLLPVITLVGYNIGSLIGGAVVIEAVFNLPGIGSALVYAVNARDYPVVQGTALITAILVVLVNATADIFYQFVDPRTRPV